MPYDVQFRWQAEAALQSLSPIERDRVLFAVQRLRDCRLDAAPEIYRLKMGDGEVFVFRVDDALRLLFTQGPEDRITVTDIVNRQFALRYG